MINYVHDRLLLWASAALSDTLGALSYSSIQFDVEADYAANRDTVALWSPAVDEIERAVNDLRHELRDTIKAIYLEPEATMTQSAKRCCCNVRTLRRRRDAAHSAIADILQANKSFYARVGNNCGEGVRLVENAT